MKIALVRHPAPAIAPGHCYGRLDMPLSPEGLAALPTITSALAAFADADIWTSPAQRCATVAEALGRPARRDARLLELDFGAWEGRSWNDVPREALDRWAADPAAFTPPGGERVADLVARVQSLHDELRRDRRDRVVITHGGVLKVLAPLLRHRPVDLAAPAPALGSVEIITCPT